MFRYRIDEQSELRLLELRHAEELFAQVDANRHYLRQWLPWLDDVSSAADSASFIKRTLQQLVDNNGFQAGIWCDGELVGSIGYHGINWARRITSIGYWLAAQHQGKGLMTKSCRGLVDHALGDLGLNRIQITCAVENKKSRAIPERLGFTEEGIARQAEWLYDHHVDCVRYAILAV